MHANEYTRPPSLFSSLGFCLMFMASLVVLVIFPTLLALALGFSCFDLLFPPLVYFTTCFAPLFMTCFGMS